MDTHLSKDLSFKKLKWIIMPYSYIQAIHYFCVNKILKKLSASFSTIKHKYYKSIYTCPSKYLYYYFVLNQFNRIKMIMPLTGKGQLVVKENENDFRGEEKPSPKRDTREKPLLLLKLKERSVYTKILRHLT